MHIFQYAAALAAAFIPAAGAITLDINNLDSIRDAAKIAAEGLTSYYVGNKPGGTPGLLPQPHYWWEAGGMFGALIDYWHYTGDSQYNDMTTQALSFQGGLDYIFEPKNQTNSEGNDDQVFWAFAAMTAAEYKFLDPPTGPGWAAMAQAVFNRQVERWNTAGCNGGLRWQMQSYAQGYDYMNAPTNGGFLNLASRLYAYIGNTTYSIWANKTWDWMSSRGLIAADFTVNDGTSSATTPPCKDVNRIQWTYNSGMLLHAAAVMWNETHKDTSLTSETTMWKERTQGIWNASAAVYFNNTNRIMVEVACEVHDDGAHCNLDQQGFKSYFSRFISASVQSAPWLYDSTSPYMAASAVAAAAQCTGGESGASCGTQWFNNGTWDGTSGPGQQQCAMQVILANLVQHTTGPVTAEHGGLSKPNATYGTGIITPLPPGVSKKEHIGGALITVFLVLGTISGGWWIVSS